MPIEFSINGATNKGGARTVHALCTSIGSVRVLALDNALVSQPTFPWAKGYRSQVEARVRGW